MEALYCSLGLFSWAIDSRRESTSMGNHARWTGDLWASLTTRTHTDTQVWSAIPILHVT
jgi:hypothetical protein